MGSHDRNKRGVCAEERESIPIVERGKRRSEGVYKGVAEERIYSAVKITTNGASVLHRKKRWKEEDGARLQIFE